MLGAVARAAARLPPLDRPPAHPPPSAPRRLVASSLAFSPDATKIASVTPDGVVLLDAATRRELRRLDAPGAQVGVVVQRLARQ